jgi:hypothetical protein
MGDAARRVASGDFHICGAVGRLYGPRFVHLYFGWRAHRYTLGVATAVPLVVSGGLLIYAKLIATGTLSWTSAASFVLGAFIMLPLIWGARRSA